MRYGQLKVAVLGSVLGLLATACAPQSAVEQQAKEIAELKRQIGKLQSMTDVNSYKELTSMLAASQKMLENFQKFSNSNVTAWNTVAALERRTAALEVAQTNSSHATQAALSTSKNKAITAAAPAEAMKDGIPLSVWNELFQKEQKRWPGDYTVQKIQLEAQIKAYKELHR